MSKERNVRFDIIKAIGIISVVLGHTYVKGASEIVNLYHVALFFIVSGIFYKESYTDTIKGVGSVLLKRIKRLYLPFVFYNLFFLCFRNALTTFGFLEGAVLDLNGMLRQAFGIVRLVSGETLPGPDWFIRALFIMEVAFTIVDFILKKLFGKGFRIARWVFAAACLGVGYYMNIARVLLATNYYTIPLNIGTIMSCWILFTAGFELPKYLRKLKFVKEWKLSYDIISAAAGLIVLCILMQFGGIAHADNYYPNIPFFIIATIAGFVFAYGLAGLLEKTPSLIRRFFVFTGGVTLEILMMHLTGFKIVTLIYVLIAKRPRAELAAFPVATVKLWIPYLIVGMAFSLVFAFVWGKMKDLFKAKLGNKRIIAYVILGIVIFIVPYSLQNKLNRFMSLHPDYDIVFDKDYYLEKNADLVDAFGEDPTKDELLAHFISNGMAEGRVASPDFDPHFYRIKYSDLEGLYGDDWTGYYKHFMLHGYKEGREGARPSAERNFEASLSAEVVNANTVGLIFGAAEDKGECVLVRLKAYSEDVNEGTVILSLSLDGDGTLETEFSDINDKYVIASGEEGNLTQLSNIAYIKNAGEYINLADRTVRPLTKKGLQIGENMIDDVLNLDTKTAFTNLIVSRLMSGSKGSDTIAYEYKGREYYFNEPELKKLDGYFSELTKAGVSITCGIITLFDEGLEDLYYEEAVKEQGATFYALNTASEDGLLMTEAFTDFISKRYDGSDETKGVISSFTIGNEVNESRTYNFMGPHMLEDYITEYTRTFRVLYNVIKTNIPCANIYVPIEPWWGVGSDDYTYAGRDFMYAFAARMKEEGDIDWGLAYHAYSFPLSDPKVLNDYKRVIGEDGELTLDKYFTTDDENSVTITMENLEVLVDFMKKDELLDKNHEVRSIILSEQGYTSNSNVYGKCEALQAASLVYAYYKSESIPEIDAFIYFLELDDANASLGNSYYQFGLSYEGENGGILRKMSYDVYKIMDSRDSLTELSYIRDILGIESFKEVINGFDEGVFASMDATPLSEEKADIKDAVISKIPECKATGREILPDVEVTLDGKTLINDKDYDLVYLNNEEPGTAVVLAVGMGEYKGITRAEFVITE